MLFGEFGVHADLHFKPCPLPVLWGQRWEPKFSSWLSLRLLQPPGAGDELAGGA